MDGPTTGRQRAYFLILIAFGALAVWFGWSHGWLWNSPLNLILFLPGMMLGALVCGLFRFP